MYRTQVVLRESTRGNVHADVSCKSHYANAAAWVKKTHVVSSTGWTLNRVATCIMRLAWNVCAHIPIRALLQANLHRAHAASRVLKAARASIKLSPGSSSRSSLFTVHSQSRPMHNSSVSLFYPYRFSIIPHLAEVRRYGCNGTYQ
jgi:hypothetical protein